MADSAAMVLAPVQERAPRATTTVPDLNLLPVGARRGTRSRLRSLTKPAAAGRGALRGMPISTTSTRPEWDFPGFTYRPTFGPWNVAVTSASTAPPRTSPVEALTPEGTSQAMTT